MARGQKVGLKVTVSVVHTRDRGMDTGYHAFVTYKGYPPESRPPDCPHRPTHREFSVSASTNPRRKKGMDPQQTLDLVRKKARAMARHCGIAMVHGLDDLK